MCYVNGVASTDEPTKNYHPVRSLLYDAFFLKIYIHTEKNATPS